MSIWSRPIPPFVAVAAVAIVLCIAWIFDNQHRHNSMYCDSATPGLRVDVEVSRFSIGIPGQENLYTAVISNCGRAPAALQGCDYVSDANYPGTDYPYMVQRWDDVGRRWKDVGPVVDNNDCRPVALSTIHAHTSWHILWPRTEATVMGFEATGARSEFHRGDSARFVVFSRSRPSLDWTTAVASSAFPITDSVERDGIDYKIKH